MNSLTPTQIKSNQEQYTKLINEISDSRWARPKEEFLNKLFYKDPNNDRALNFFEQPASTKFHLSCIGGLCAHSLNVYKELCLLIKTHGLEAKYSPDTIKIVSLFHDIDKFNSYELDIKCEKIYTRPITDMNQRPNFNNVQSFRVIEDRFTVGSHGENSLYITQSFIKLTPEEWISIEHHMGTFGKTDKEARDITDIQEKYPLAFFLHIADNICARYLENKEDSDEVTI